MRGWVWGVDVSTRCVAIAFACEDGSLGWDSVPLPKNQELSEGERLGEWYHQTWFRACMLANDWQPACVCVEHPTGPTRIPMLDRACGVVSAALARATRAPVWIVSIGQWKRLSVGKGNAKKDEVMAWAIDQGYTGASQDEADALGVAVAGRSLVLETSYELT